MKKKLIRFGLVMNEAEREALRQLADYEDITEAEFLRRFVIVAAKKQGIWGAIVSQVFINTHPEVILKKVEV